MVSNVFLHCHDGTDYDNFITVSEAQVLFVFNSSRSFYITMMDIRSREDVEEDRICSQMADFYARWLDNSGYQIPKLESSFSKELMAAYHRVWSVLYEERKSLGYFS